VRESRTWFFVVWVTLSVAGYAFAGYFGHFPGGYTGEDWKWSAALVGFVFGTATGGAVGLLQWLALKAFGFGGGGRWTLAHMAAFAATHAFLDFRSGALPFLWISAAGGAALGVLVASARKEGAAGRLIWAAAGGLSWLAGLAASGRWLHGPSSAFMMNHIYDSIVVGLLCGAAFGLLLARRDAGGGLQRAGNRGTRP